LFCFSIFFFVISCLHCYIADDLFWIACYITFKMYKNTTSLNWCLILQYSTWFCQLKQPKIKFIIGKKRKPVFFFFFYCSWGKKKITLVLGFFIHFIYGPCFLEFYILSLIFIFFYISVLESGVERKSPENET